ncbi:hypothetical protein FRC07_004080 [Ceratobasidium sp. 392]|nr:hypothetical protein FRC07_004080 [Ceratobasidium sp. 392]
MSTVTSGTAPPRSNRNEAIKAALEKWQAARVLLTDATQSLCAASTILREACIEISSSQAIDRSGLETALVAIDSELEILASEEHRLNTMRMSLATIRNKSTTLARINKLPLETLARIFVLSSTGCVCDDKYNRHNIVSVCTYWRQIALETPDLWTHIDIHPNTPDDVINLMLKRTRNSLIHVHAYDVDYKLPRHKSTADLETEIAKKMQLLAPYVPLIYALNLESPGSAPEFVRAVVNLWLINGWRLPKSLAVVRPNCPRVLSFKRGGYDGAFIEPTDNGGPTQSFPGMLRLKDVYLDWDFISYHDLVDLRLSFHFMSPNSVPTRNFIKALSASPSLTTIKLVNFSVTPTEEWSIDKPVMLNHLKVFSVVSLLSSSLVPLLHTFALPDSPVEVNIEAGDIGTVRQDLERVFLNSQLSTLCLRFGELIHSALPLVRFLLSSLCNLDTLVLQSFCLNKYIKASATVDAPPQPTPATYNPAVVLLKCRVTLRGLQGLIDYCQIRDLRLEQCLVYGASGPTVEEIRTSLMKVYPELQCSVSDTDSTSHLSCRITF